MKPLTKKYTRLKNIVTVFPEGWKKHYRKMLLPQYGKGFKTAKQVNREWLLKPGKQ